MLLYTIVDVESIFHQDQPSVTSFCRLAENAFLEQRSSENGLQISRIISTNPTDYLDNRYQIGKAIK